MTTDRLIPLMINRPGIQYRFHVTKHLLDLPELLVLQRHLFSGELCVGLKHPLAVKARFPGYLLLINPDMAALNAKESILKKPIFLGWQEFR